MPKKATKQADWEKRLAKWQWAKNNPDKVKRANQLYRSANRRRTNDQAAARMRRYRARLQKIQNSSKISP